MLLYYEHRQNPGNDGEESGVSFSLMEFIRLHFDRLETFDSIQNLINRLQQSVYDVTSVILMVKTRMELELFLDDRELLKDVYLMVFLLNDTPEMISLATRLSPRYLGSWNNKKEIIDTVQKFLHVFENRLKHI